MVREQLTKVINLRISPSELEMLEQLSEESGLPMSGVLRQLLRKDHAAKFGGTVVKSSKTKRKR
jgi:hypothetical protein